MLVFCSGVLWIQASPRFWPCPPSSPVCQPLCRRCLTSKPWTSTCGPASCLSFCRSLNMLRSTISPQWKRWRSWRMQRYLSFFECLIEPFVPYSIITSLALRPRFCRSPAPSTPTRRWLLTGVSMIMTLTLLHSRRSTSPQTQTEALNPGTPRPLRPQMEMEPGSAAETR